MDNIRKVTYFVGHARSTVAVTQIRNFYFFVCICISFVILRQQLTITVSSDITLNDISEELGNASRKLSNYSGSPPRKSFVLPPIVTDLFNTSCPVDLLGVPDYVSYECSRNVTNCKYANLTCRDLLSGQSGDDSIYNYSRQFMSDNKKHDINDETFMQMTSDCAVFRRTRGFDKKAAIEEDIDFSIAFNLLVHKNVEMVERLIYGLYRRQHHFCIHIDTKADNVFKMTLQSIARCLPNVFVASKLENVVYAGFSRLQADINCMKDHLERNSDWRYVINTAGEAYPLRSQKEMIHILRLYNGSNDIEGIYGPRYLRNRYLNEYVESTNPPSISTTGKQNTKPPHDIEIVKGSAYGAFSRGFVQYLLTNQKARDLLEWMRTTYSPDELYWATLNYRYVNPHLHVPGAAHGHPTDRLWTAVYANWVDKCYGRGSHGICITGVADLPNIVKRHQLFINKFHSDFEPLAIECLRAWIDHKEICPVDYNYDFYKQLTQH